METTCAGCGCVVKRGVRLTSCGDGRCCCRNLVTQDRLDLVAETVRRSVEVGDPTLFAGLLSDDVRWGSDGSPGACRGPAQVEATLRRGLGVGATGEVVELWTGPAGVACRLRVHWPQGHSTDRRDEVIQLYRLRNGLIASIEPFDDEFAARRALATL